MFTGIIEATGKIANVVPLEAGLRVQVVSEALDFSGVREGDSIAVNGACMTVVAKTEHSFKFDASAETLSCTANLDQLGVEVNLERATRLGERLDGHIVSGHVDTIGEVLKFAPAGESWTLVVRVPKEFTRFIATKGSIVVNGVSLTTNVVKDVADRCVFSVNLIPHTVEKTAMRLVKVQDKVNVEIDLIARYVERVLSLRKRA